MMDKRISYTEICGKEFPLCLTVAAEQKIIDRFGGLQQMAEAMDNGEAGIPVIANLAHILLEGGAARVKALAWMEGKESNAPEVPKLELLQELLDLKDATDLAPQLFAAIKVSRGVTVETQEEENKGKNAETTQE